MNRQMGGYARVSTKQGKECRKKRSKNDQIVDLIHSWADRELTRREA